MKTEELYRNYLEKMQEAEKAAAQIRLARAQSVAGRGYLDDARKLQARQNFALPQDDERRADGDVSQA